jgi:hypothetical protein
MDTSEQAILVETPKREPRRRRSVEEKRRIVEETLEAGASVARVARRHSVNANQVFYWRKKYREGRLRSGKPPRLQQELLGAGLGWPFVCRRTSPNFGIHEPLKGIQCAVGDS